MGFLRRLFENDKARNQKMRSASVGLNLNFADVNDTGMHQQLSDFKLFSHGNYRKIINIISESSLDSENYLFDYEFSISNGKSRKVYKQTVLFINSKQLSLPQFYQKPESIFTKLLTLLGFQDINFDNFHEYSNKFNLKGEYEEVIRYYFSKEVLDLLATQKDLYIEGMNYYLILYQKDKLCPPAQLKSFRNLGLMLYKLFLLQCKIADDADGKDLRGLV